ncbi:MAG: aspartate--tRNA ligase [Candidatus Dormibacteria bacterium]
MTTERTGCGVPRKDLAGSRMTVYGWVDRRRDHGGVIFIDLRDRSGILQIVINSDKAHEAYEQAKDVRLEWVLKVTGELRMRDPEAINPNKTTGEVELHVSECEILARAATPPFPVNEDSEVDESIRLRYRYLYLRRDRIQRNLKKRATFVHALRTAMMEQDFTEIETPLLIRATPEGARDYLVPSRIFPGSFYALPQSPQLYKQLCMVGGLDRYFQIARCLRDEDLRADRQPEFTQLDIEMSFVSEEDIFQVLERTLSTAWNAAEFNGTLPSTFPRMTWREAMDRYGVDKPDVRFGLELVDLGPVFRNTSFKVFADVLAKGGVVKGIVIPGGCDIPRSDMEHTFMDIVHRARAHGLTYLYYREEGWVGPAAKFLSADEWETFDKLTQANRGDAVVIVADTPGRTAAALGSLRNHLGAVRKLYDPRENAILWVTEFPMFERDEDTGVVGALHHPFTMVHADDIDKMTSDPLMVRSRAYDIVMNGREIGSGSIRITNPDIQRKVFEALSISPEDQQRKFGFLLEAFEYGPPPHGGFAAGIDRLIMEGLREENIRDVIAFPKNQQAQELMTMAPALVDEAQLRELGIETISDNRHELSPTKS